MPTRRRPSDSFPVSQTASRLLRTRRRTPPISRRTARPVRWPPFEGRSTGTCPDRSTSRCHRPSCSCATSPRVPTSSRASPASRRSGPLRSPRWIGASTSPATTPTAERSKEYLRAAAPSEGGGATQEVWDDVEHHVLAVRDTGRVVSCVPALEYHRKLEQRERLVVRQRSQIAARAFCITRRHLVAPRVALDAAGLHADQRFLAALGPSRQQVSDVEQRVADGPRVPVDDRREAGRRVGRDHHVDRAVVAVNDAGGAHRRTVVLEPTGDEVEL